MKILLLVLGMGRSGSSLLSGLCNLAGLRIPGPMLPAAPDNPQGFFEPLEVLEANQRYLERMDSSWYDVSLRPLLEPDGEALRLLQVDIDRLFDLHPAPLIVIKEPRMVITAPSWIAAAERRGYRVVFALPLRHPHEVIGSLRARDGLSPDHSASLWLKYNLVAERLTRGRQRTVVFYDAVLADWRQQIDRLARQLDLPLTLQDVASDDPRLPLVELRHQRNEEVDPGPLTRSAQLAAVFTELLAAADDQVPNEAVLNQAFETLRPEFS